MDHRTFDRLTQRVSRAGSRRQALGALLGAALAGISTGEVAAKPKDKADRPNIARCSACKSPPHDPGQRAFCCSGQHCSCNGTCCNNRCFWEDRVVAGVTTTREFCCAAPELIICGGGADATCCKNEGPNPCAKCIGPSGLAGSYRRP